MTGLDNVHRLAGGSGTLVDGQGLYAKSVPTPAVSISVPPDVAATVMPAATAPMKIPAGTDFRCGGVKFADCTVRAGWDKQGLAFQWTVDSSTTLFANNGTDWTLLFATGDACDLQLKSPTLGRCRFVVSTYKDKPDILRLLYDAKDTGKAIDYKSDVADLRVPAVELLDVHRSKSSYTIQFILPWDVLGIEPKKNLPIPAELGLFRADPTGTKAVIRNYWIAARLAWSLTFRRRPHQHVIGASGF